MYISLFLYTVHWAYYYYYYYYRIIIIINNIITADYGIQSPRPGVCVGWHTGYITVLVSLSWYHDYGILLLLLLLLSMTPYLWSIWRETMPDLMDLNRRARPGRGLLVPWHYVCLG